MTDMNFELYLTYILALYLACILAYMLAFYLALYLHCMENTILCSQTTFLSHLKL